MSGIVLAIVMAFTMLPSLPTVAAAAGSFDKQTITMHFKPASQWDKVYTYIKQESIGIQFQSIAILGIGLELR